MELDTTQCEGAAVVRVLGSRIDSAGAVQFKDAVKAASRTTETRVILDLGQVDFVDSSGLGAIVAVMKGLPAGVSLELAAMRDPVQKVFQLTRMDSVFRIFPNVPSALKA